MNVKHSEYICRTVLKISKTLLTALFIACCCHVFAQNDTAGQKDTKVRPEFVSIRDLEILKFQKRHFDTSLNGIHLFNRYRKDLEAYQDLGMIGTSIQGLSLAGFKTAGFDFGLNSSAHWLYNTRGDDEKLIIAPTPYTAIKYCQGEKELITLEAFHSQNITKRWNVGLDYRRIKTNNYLYFLNGDVQSKIRIPGIYNLKLFSSFHSKNDKFYTFSGILYNKINQRETGGLSEPLGFDSTSGKRRVFENPLSNANSTIMEPAFFLKNYYRFGKTNYQTKYNDSMISDTLGFEFKPRGYIFHGLHASKSAYRFKDLNADTPYYPIPFETGFNDSMAFKQMNHSLGFAIHANYKSFTSFIKSWSEFSNYSIFNNRLGQLVYHNVSVNGEMYSSLSSKLGALELNARGNLYLSGYNAKDYLFNGGIKLLFSDKLVMNGMISSQRHAATFVQSIYYSSPITWKQSLKPTYRNGLDAGAEWIPLKLKFGISALNFQNYYLFMPHSQPQGFDFNYLSIYVSQSSNIGKVHWNNRIHYQKVSKTFHLPEWWVAGGVYFENRFFRKNMLARIGMDYYWFSSYFADEYNPYLRQFVWQNSNKIGNYPYLDFYASAQVLTMELYIRFEHLNEGLSGNRYYATPLYPNNPRFFRFGVNWRLFN